MKTAILTILLLTSTTAFAQFGQSQDRDPFESLERLLSSDAFAEEVACSGITSNDLITSSPSAEARADYCETVGYRSAAAGSTTSKRNVVAEIVGLIKNIENEVKVVKTDVRNVTGTVNELVRKSNQPATQTTRTVVREVPAPAPYKPYRKPFVPSDNSGPRYR